MNPFKLIARGLGLLGRLVGLQPGPDVKPLQRACVWVESQAGGTFCARCGGTRVSARMFCPGRPKGN